MYTKRKERACIVASIGLLILAGCASGSLENHPKPVDEPTVYTAGPDTNQSELATILDDIATSDYIDPYIYNVAVCDQPGTLVDEDGDTFIIDGVEPGVYWVAYDHHGTVTRMDDTPIDWERIAD